MSKEKLPRGTLVKIREGWVRHDNDRLWIVVRTGSVLSVYYRCKSLATGREEMWHVSQLEVHNDG